MTEDMIREIDKDHSGSIDKFEFVSYILVGQGKVEPEDVAFAVSLFK